MRFKTLAAALVALLTASSAQAGVITLGTWSPTPLPSNYGETFFDHRSFDGAYRSIGWLLPAGTEYLHDGSGGAVPFGFVGWGDLGQKVISITGFPEGKAGYDGQTFSFDNAHGLTFSSGDGFNMALFRKREPGQTVFWLAVEDLLHFDDDYNDAVFMAVLIDPGSARDLEDDDPPADPEESVVPEPPVVALATAGLAACARRRRKR